MVIANVLSSKHPQVAAEKKKVPTSLHSTASTQNCPDIGSKHRPQGHGLEELTAAGSTLNISNFPFKAS